MSDFTIFKYGTNKSYCENNHHSVAYETEMKWNISELKMTGKNCQTPNELYAELGARVSSPSKLVLKYCSRSLHLS